VAAALVVASLSQASAAPPPDSAMTLLCAALSAPATVSYAGVVEAVRIGREFSEASVYRVEHRAPDLTRRSYTAPPPLDGESIVTRGDTDYVIDPKRRHVTETPNDSPEDRNSFARDADLLRANYRAVARDSDAFDGRSTLMVTAIDRFTNRPLLMVRIDRETKLVLDRQEFDANGSLRSESHFDVVRVTTAPLADFVVPDDFTLSKAVESNRSTDIMRVAHDAGFDARAPRQLAEGFSPLEADSGAVGSARNLHILYSDGVRAISLFESASTTAPEMAPFHPEAVIVGKRTGEYAVDGATALLSWSDGARCYTLVGEITLPELQRLAASVTPPLAKEKGTRRPTLGVPLRTSSVFRF
jgi:outer membrane lipoprotein-sorting protein